MISVLIPVHNYSIIPLVEELHKQLESSKVLYELIVWDDASTEAFYLQNKIINHVPNLHYFNSKEHFGKIKTRQLLADKAMFDWLLFIDAETLPKTPSFIQNYLDLIPKNYDAIFGGLFYGNQPPKQNYRLQWNYGRLKKQVDSAIRNEQPYQEVALNNFMIKRKIFLNINSKMEDLGLYSDDYFGALMGVQKVNVFHNENAVFHLGVKPNDLFLEDLKTSIDEVLKIHSTHPETVESIKVWQTYSRLKRKKIVGLAANIYKRFQVRMESKLLGENPSMNVLKFYEKSYLSYKIRNQR